MIDRLSAWCAVAVACLFCIIGGAVTFEVIARYGFTAPTIWAEEISRLCLVWAVYLGAAHVMRRGELLRITLLTDRLGLRSRRAAECFSLAVIGAFACVALFWGTAVAADSIAVGRTTTTLLALPSWLSEAAIPIGAAPLLLQTIVQFVRVFGDETNARPGP